MDHYHCGFVGSAVGFEVGCVEVVDAVVGFCCVRHLVLKQSVEVIYGNGNSRSEAQGRLVDSVLLIS